MLVDLEGIAKANDEGMDNFGKNISLSFHVINMILLYDGIFSHDFHGVNPIIIIPRIKVSTFLPHLEDLPEGALTYHPENLKVVHANPPSFRLRRSFSLRLSLAVELRDLEGERGGGGEARRGAEEGVRAAVDNGRVAGR